MAALDTGFSELMMDVMKELRPKLIKGLNLDEEFFAYLISLNIFQTTDYITAERVPISRARKLLDDLQRRPGADFWKFIWILFRTHQGHLGQLILHEYEQRGGTNIPQDIRQLRQDCQQDQQRPNQLPLHQQQLNRLSLQYHQPQPQNQSHDPTMDVDAPGHTPNRNETMQGNLLTQDTWGRSSAAATPALPGVEQTDARQQQHGLQHDDGDSPNVTMFTKYQRKMQEDPQSVFKMETNPRGYLLLIDNECFEHLANRDGTQRDSESICDVFQNKLGFACLIRRDCTAEMMVQALKEFAQLPELNEVDSIVVAIFSHGSQGDKIFGTNGRVVNGRPAAGTYVTAFELSSIFSTNNCLAMKGKPKLFIIQACRGVLEDRMAQPVGRDIVIPEYPCEMPNFIDRYFLFATVENYVAYRGQFVQLLAEVLHQFADTKHIKDIATQLHNKMSLLKVGEHIFTIGEDRGNLTKDWYLNPPTTHNC